VRVCGWERVVLVCSVAAELSSYCGAVEGSPLTVVVICEVSWEYLFCPSDLPGRVKQLPVPLIISKASRNQRHIVDMIDVRFLVNRGKET
jgi:hypothetical protein